jgi:hypothetical protein
LDASPSDGHARIQFDEKDGRRARLCLNLPSEDAILLHNKAVPAAPATMPLSKTQNSR